MSAASTTLWLGRGADALARLPACWPAAPTPFQTAGWVRAWITAAAGAEGAHPVLLSVETAEGRPVFAGLQVHHEPSGPVLRPLSWPWADYHRAWWAGTPQDPEPQRAAEALASALVQLQSTEGADLDLPDVAAGDLLHRAALLAGAQQSPASPVVSIDLTDTERVAAILGRKETVRKGRLLGRRGRLDLVHWRDRRDLRARLPAFFAMHARQWRQRADVVAPFDGGVTDRTFACVAAQPDTGVVLSELRVDSVPIAMYYGFLFGSRYWAYRTTFDAAYRRLSPGHQLVAMMIDDFAGSGVRAFDLMRGDYPYKADYASSILHNVHLGRSRSRALEPTKEHHVRHTILEL